MSFFDRIFNRNIQENKKSTKEKNVTLSDIVPKPLMGSSPPIWNTRDYLKAARSWAGACISAISDDVASIELHLYKRTKGGSDAEEIFEHPALDVLYKVNDFTTKFDHFWLTQQYLESIGEAPWFLEIVGGQVRSIYLLRPDFIEIVFDNQKIIKGYKYTIDARKEIFIEPQELIFIKYPSLLRQFRGEGTLSQAQRTVDLDNYSEEWNLNFFYNSARPDAILTAEGQINELQQKQMKDSWKKEFKGIDNRAKLAILTGGLKYTPMNFSQKDMEFLKQQQFSRDKILSIFRVPKTILGMTEGVNRATAEAADYVFAKRTIKPKMQRLIEQLNEFYMPLFGEDLYLTFTDPVPQNQEAIAKMSEIALKAGYMTVNEVRELQELSKIDEGNVLRVPMGYEILGEVEQSKRILNPQLNEKRNEVKRFFNTRRREKIQKEKNMDDRIFDLSKSFLKESKQKEIEREKQEEENEKEMFWRDQIAISELAEKEFIKEIRKIFKKQETIVLNKLKGKKASKIDPKKVVFSIDQQNKIFVKTFTPIIEDIIKKEGDVAYHFRKKSITKQFDMTTEAIREYLKVKIILFAASVNETTINTLVAKLQAGIVAGEGMVGLAKRVKEAFNIAETSRALAIARTETIKASNFATEEAYVQRGVKQKEWLTSFDERTCDWCAQMNGKVIKVGDNYFNKGDSFTNSKGGTLNFDYDNIQYPPIHTNCRCTLIPVVKV